MKKVLVASLLSAAVLATFAPGSPMAQAQAAPATPATPAASAPPAADAGQVQLSPAEFAVYNNAISQATPQAKAPALEAYLTTYPQSPVKADVLQQLMAAYAGFDPAKTIDAADRLLQLDPNNLRALIFEVFVRGSQAAALTDAAAKQTALDAASGFATKGIAAEATQPKGMSDADFTTLKGKATPIFYGAIGAAALNKKDYPAAIAAYTSELQGVPLADTTQPGPLLQDTYYLGQAYYASTPPDYVNCTFYTTRAASYAPAPFNAQLQPLATYCYKKYHGNSEGYDAVVTAAKANLTPPAGFTITPAPKASDIAHSTVTSTADLATLALSDKEFILTNGTPEDADKVFATIKGKTVEIPGGTVIEATESVVKLAVSDDAVQSKTADFTFNMKEPLKTVPAVGAKISLTGTYDSYTQSPAMIVMSDAEPVAAKKAAPVHKPAPRRR